MCTTKNLTENIMIKNNFPLAGNGNTFGLCLLGEIFMASGICSGFSAPAKWAVG